LLLPLAQIIQLLSALVVLVKQEALVLFFLALKQLAVAMVGIGVMLAFLVVLVVEPETGLVGQHTLEVLELLVKDLLAAVHQSHNILAAQEAVVLVQLVLQ
jgi:hypothetical protein